MVVVVEEEVVEVVEEEVVVEVVEVEFEVEIETALCVLTGWTPPPHAQQPAAAVTPVADGKSSIDPQAEDHPTPGRPAGVQYDIVAHQLHDSKSELSQFSTSVHS